MHFNNMLINEKGLPYFYKITNKLNGKYYYGSGQKTGYCGSGVALHRAYRKHGKNNFAYEVLRYFQTRESAYRFEQLFLSIYKLDLDSMSYNCVRNAGGGYVSEEHYVKARDWMKSYRKTEEGSIKGLKNPRADRTLYEFYNIDTKELKTATVYEMNTMVNGGKGASMYGYVVRGDRKTYKGWILASNIYKWGTRQLLKDEHRSNLSLSKIDKHSDKISNSKKGCV